ncbi:MAG: hypothetical protein M1834_002419 [Cirrosporium novae-zelandiae]|nr:MAG: hypothetical protein M1834_002419 [Cirrosporium novae-zelandiae]
MWFPLYFLVTTIIIARPTLAYYSLEDNYSGGPSFLDSFDFFIGQDPTNGFVTYVDNDTAVATGLFVDNGKSVRLAVDALSTLDPNGPGRNSVRITSKKIYNHGLFIADISHMPGGICGTWPAFWTLGTNWPDDGEIDIIEGVNNAMNNLMVLHTSDGCSIQSDIQDQLGSVIGDDCYAFSDQNTGCRIAAPDHYHTYGKNFNAIGGGIYAMEWTSEAIKIWFFPRYQIPRNINSAPDPSSWGPPTANFQGCDIDSHFRDHSIVFDTTFCGDYAGGVWESSSCARLPSGSTCNNYVANNPGAFAHAYWQINSLAVYQNVSANSTTITTTTSSSSPQSQATITHTVPVIPKPENSHSRRPTMTGLPGGHHHHPPHHPFPLAPGPVIVSPSSDIPFPPLGPGPVMIPPSMGVFPLGPDPAISHHGSPIPPFVPDIGLLPPIPSIPSIPPIPPEASLGPLSFDPFDISLTTTNPPSSRVIALDDLIMESPAPTNFQNCLPPYVKRIVVTTTVTLSC